MSRRRFYAGSATTVRVSEPIAQGRKAFHDGGATSEDLLEHLFCVLTRRNVQCLGGEPVQLWQITTVVVTDR